MSPSSTIISLTTDFGLEDWFVGTMKGVILDINPGARLIDITHTIPPGNIRAGAFALAASYRFFPKGSVHLAVVDPGVGSQRRALAVQTDNYFFVAPDNGLLSWALRQEKVRAIHALQNPSYFRRSVSATFHGRDIFAPVAAHLSRGLGIGQLGPSLNRLERIPWPEPRRGSQAIEGEVVYVDRFGNAITNIPGQYLPDLVKRKVSVCLGGRRLCGLGPYYQASPPGTPIAVFGSSGFLEIAINGANAAQQFGIQPGQPVGLLLTGSDSKQPPPKRQTEKWRTET